jgi:hypothetical protein
LETLGAVDIILQGGLGEGSELHFVTSSQYGYYYSIGGRLHL